MRLKYYVLLAKNRQSLKSFNLLGLFINYREFCKLAILQCYIIYVYVCIFLKSEVCQRVIILSSYDQHMDCCFLSGLCSIELNLLGFVQGLNQGAKNKFPIVGSAALNLAEFASNNEEQEIELKIPLSLSGAAAQSCSLLCVRMISGFYLTSIWDHKSS